MCILSPLDDEQIGKFPKAKNLDNFENFFNEVNRSGYKIFTSRPDDLLGLIKFWNKYKRFDNRLNLLKNNIEEKILEADTRRDEILPLSKEKTLEGAKLLAAATILQEEANILVSDQGGDRKGINAKKILQNCNAKEIKALLNRPIFDPASYGTVKFHHRIVKEYLAAEWLCDLLNQGKSRKEIESLFLRTEYGVQVVTPLLGYLRDKNSKTGVLLLLRLNSEDRKWKHPKTQNRLGFDALTNSLQEYIDKIIRNNLEIEQIKVIGIDVTRRLKKVNKVNKSVQLAKT